MKDVGKITQSTQVAIFLWIFLKYFLFIVILSVAPWCPEITILSSATSLKYQLRRLSLCFSLVDKPQACVRGKKHGQDSSSLATVERAHVAQGQLQLLRCAIGTVCVCERERVTKGWFDTNTHSRRWERDKAPPGVAKLSSVISRSHFHNPAHHHAPSQDLSTFHRKSLAVLHPSVTGISNPSVPTSSLTTNLICFLYFPPRQLPLQQAHMSLSSVLSLGAEVDSCVL